MEKVRLSSPRDRALASAFIDARFTPVGTLVGKRLIVSPTEAKWACKYNGRIAHAATMRLMQREG